MNQEQSGGQENKMETKLQEIDRWLETIADPNAPLTPQQVISKNPVSNTPPSKPLTPPPPQSQQNPLQRPKPGFNKPNFKSTQNPKMNNQPQRNQARNQKSQPPYSQKQEKPFQSIPTSRPMNIKGKLRIIPLGGFEEVGKNMMLFEYENDIIIVDMGFQFPEEDMLGIDYVLPDISYLIQNKHKIRGIFLTHGHLDHIGGIPYLIPKLGFPTIYGAPLTIGFVKKQLEEFELLKLARIHTFDPKERFKVGVFEVSFFRVNHSIPDAVAVVIDTPAGRIVHTGDFKFDFTPADQKPADFQEIASVGKRGVAVLISDSTNSLKPGHTTSEKVIAENLEEIIRNAKGRLIITSFSSLIGRLQQIMDSSIKHGRKIFLSGRSMATNIKIAQQLGYIKVPKGVIADIRSVRKFPDEKIIILTTGSQGEDVSALARMAMNTHAQVSIQKGDTVVLSSNPIIGNENAIVKVINGLCKQGAKVITNNEIDVHTSGHARQEDLKLMIKLINPKYLIPAHGDLYMRMAHRDIGTLCGLPEGNSFLIDNGQVVEGTRGEFQKTKEKVPAEYIMVEGPEKSEVAAPILMDRQLMSKNGVVMVLMMLNKNGELEQKPKVMSKGFVFMEDSENILKQVIETSEQSLKTFKQSHPNGFHEKEAVEVLQHSIDRLLVRLLDKRPLVVPILCKTEKKF